ncbi:hypothetical protein Desaci_3265 [Desulfosporosinus acidiphilus SJ4]|uniref:Uncharacterized protein n=1 Tax=Desulfosporosinus acidiphilus (strain DSM 22704 / JCM 16185 / SJ4) TaxID=646529 RepID=I4D8N7_DESAJ|nr:hypothetical protein [Desulfosporosinus acidiphilus]AFM42161.1 hypothetical protein Desaci_3265 [Desulfosporosinus acidiphilus SJ4]
MKKALILVSLFVGLVVLILLIQGRTPDWAQYQREYFKEQAATLHAQLNSTKDEAKRTQLKQEIKSFQNQKPEIIDLVLPNGKVERCKTCHIGIEEISSSHPSNTFGCVACHGGNPLSLDKGTAHDQMYGGGHPGSLNTASLSCGGTAENGMACHSGNQEAAKNEVDLVKTSIMSTKAGELSVVRRMFGFDKTNEVPGLVKGQTAALYPNPLQGQPNQKAFQQNCLNQCHQNGGEIPVFPTSNNLSPQGSQTGAKSQTENKITAKGCEVCHVLTNPMHTYIGTDTTMRSADLGWGMTHSLTTQIPYTQCNQCHNQGNHDPLKMSFAFRSDMTKVISDWKSGDTNYLDRVKDYYLPGEIFAQCEVSLDCIDCHTRQDVMGDNLLHTSQYEAVHLQCQDCHGTKETLPKTKKIVDPKDLAFEEQLTNPKFPALKLGDEILVTGKGEELPFIRHEGNSWVQTSRVTGKTFSIPLVYGSNCKQSLLEQGADSCHKCHDRSASHP